MRHITRWGHRMSSSVSIQARAGVDGYGKPTYGTAVVYTAHIAHKRQLVRNTNDEEVESGTQVYLMSADPVLPTAKITLSTGDIGSTEASAISPTIITTQRRFDENGPHHTVLYL